MTSGWGGVNMTDIRGGGWLLDTGQGGVENDHWVGRGKFHRQQVGRWPLGGEGWIIWPPSGVEDDRWARRGNLTARRCGSGLWARINVETSIKSWKFLILTILTRDAKQRWCGAKWQIHCGDASIKQCDTAMRRQKYDACLLCFFYCYPFKAPLCYDKKLLWPGD